MGAAGGMCCPPALEPPTPEIAKCRKLLQGLAIGLIPVAVLSLAAGQAFQFFTFLFLFVFLFLSWRTFNWCSIMFFFIYCLVQLVQSSILIAGYIQYDRFFGSKYIVESIFFLLEEIYYIVGIIISHYAYRMFKASDSGQGMLFNNNGNNNEAPLQEQAQYRALREDNPRPNNANAANANNNAGGGGFFRGEGVRIG